VNYSINIKWQQYVLRPVTLSLSICGALLATVLPAQATKHSLVIAIDGLRGDGIENASTPNIDKLIKGSWAEGYQGAFAHYAQTMKDAAPNSGPNHVGIMTGVTSSKHGVTNNSNVGSGNYTNYPHYQTLLENYDSTLNTVYLVTWGTDMAISNNADLKVDSDDSSNVRRAADIITGDFSSTDWLLGTQPDSIFLFLDDVDHAGHVCCFTSSDEGYRAEISDVDSQIGTLLTAIKGRPHFVTEDWQIVITSDHGGRGSSHGIHAADNYTIPFLVASKDVKQGYLAGVPNNYDAAPTALAHFGVPVPNNMDGIVRGNDIIAQAPTELKNGLVTYIPFSNNYNDASGNGLHASVGAGTPEFKSGGKFGSYLAIDGNQEYVTLGNPITMDFASDTDFTLFTWYRVAGDQNGDPVIIGNKNWQSGANRGVAFLANADNGDDVGMNIASSSGDRTDIKFIDYSFNGWWLLAATFDRDGVATIYAGDPKGQLHIIADDIRAVGDLTSSLNWNIGQDGTGSYPYNLKADLDDFAVWRRALTIDEISTIFAQGNGVELNQLFFNKESKYLNADFDFIAGENYHVAITAKAHGDNCGFKLSDVVINNQSNAYWDCSGNIDVMLLKVTQVSVDTAGEKQVSATLVTDTMEQGLEWDSTMNNNERNAKFSSGSAGTPITMKFVNDANDTRLFSLSGNESCGLEWDNTISNMQRNAKWDCATNSDPIRFELLTKPVEPPGTVPAQLIAHFPLNESSADVGGNGYTGSISGNVTFINQDNRQFAEFNNSGMITMAIGDNLPNLPVEAITVSAWVNTKNTDYWGGLFGLFQDNGSFEKGWLLGTRGQKFSFALASKTSSAMTYLLDEHTFELNKWYHLTATYDGSTMKLYVDGKLKSTSEAQKGNIDMPTSGWWQIGSYKDDNEDFRHDGSLNEVKLFDQALTEEKIQHLMVTTAVEVYK